KRFTASTSAAGKWIVTVSAARRSKTDSGPSSNSSSNSVRCAYPKTLPARQENRCGASLGSSSVFPLVEALLFLPRHGTCSDWEAFAVWKLDDDTEELPASRCLAEDIIHRIAPYRPGTLHQRPAKANVFDLGLLLTPPLGAERLTPRSATFR